MLFDIVFLVAVNKVPGWKIVFITDRFPDILRALDTSIAAAIAGNLILPFFHPRFLHHLLNAGFSLLIDAPTARQLVLIDDAEMAFTREETSELIQAAYRILNRYSPAMMKQLFLIKKTVAPGSGSSFRCTRWTP